MEVLSALMCNEFIYNDRYEGLVLSVGGNGRSYVLIVEAGPSADPSQSRLYFARISTKVGFCRVRIIFLLKNYDSPFSLSCLEIPSFLEAFISPVCITMAG